MEPGVTRSSLVGGQAAAYSDPEGHAGAALVLAAGNVASLGPRDALSKLFVEGKVVVMKANPVNDYLVPHWNRVLAPLVEAGVLRIVDGGAAVGEYLTAHPRIDEVHITGSDKTYDAVVFGTGPEGARRKAADEPALTKPVSAELGNVSPIIVVPGKWSVADLRYQAEHVATMLVNNAGFNCIAARSSSPTRPGPSARPSSAHSPRRWPRSPPGAPTIRARVTATTPSSLRIPRPRNSAAARPTRCPGPSSGACRPGTPTTSASTSSRSVGEVAETALTAPDPAAFVDAAVAFCNDVVWGTLGCTILASPASLKQAEVSEAVERAIADLRYGSIGFNVWHGVSFALGCTTWGAYPGHPRTDIQSGSGVVGNAAMFDRPQKSVVRGPFRSRPKPPWFATAPNSYEVMRRFVAFEADPSAAKIPGLLLSAVRH